MKLLSNVNPELVSPKSGVSTIVSPGKFRYIPSFDVVRGFAVFLVLLLHGSYGFFKGGWIGVDLFFVLSGYLITSLLLNEYLTSGEIAISKFYVRRALRLFPALIICIIIANALWPFTDLYEGASQKQATIAALLYFTNFIPGNVSGNMAHLWSLSVEEHFYLLFPIIASLFLFKISLRNCIIVLVMLIIAVSAFRIYAYNYSFQFLNGTLIIDPNTFTLCRIDSILLGAVLSITLFLSKFKKGKIKNHLTTLFLIIFLSLFVIVLFTVAKTNIIWNNGGFIFTNLLCVCTVFIAILHPHHYLLSNKILRWLGIRSYGIYVYHFPIFFAFEGLRQHHSIVNFLLVTMLRFGVTFVLAELSFKYVEKPILRIKKRYEVHKVVNIL